MKKLPGFFEVDDNGIVQAFNLQKSLQLANVNLGPNPSNHNTMKLQITDLKLSPTSYKQNYISGPLMMPQFGGQPVKEVDAPIGGFHIPSEVFTIVSNPDELQ